MSYNKFNNWIEIFKIKHTKWMLFLSLDSMLGNKLRKSSGDPQKSSKIFVHLRRSSGQYTWAVWPLTTIFGVQGCSWLYWGYSGPLWDVPGCSEGVLGVFQVCSGSVPGCSGFYRHPENRASLSFRFNLGSSRAVMDCRNLLFSIKRNCEVRSSWNFSSQKIWDDSDVCLRHNLSHNLINVARLT